MLKKKTLGLFICALAVMMVFGSFILEAEEMETGKVYHGFKLIKQKKIKEMDAVGLLFLHQKSGAHFLKIEADDDNKTFCISFKTPPESDTGLPHIMEHCVLNGSKNFPVKSPFDILAKGSLNTFLNAFTANDRTMYPVSSRNDKDFFNLMHVYLDAVLMPLIYNEPKIFQQEGWHYEMDKAEGDILYNGIVYNEMKGSFSSPERELEFQVFRHLFPDNAYRFSSGGYPEAIPRLTYEQFLSFHRRYYHPSNSYIFIYGDGRLDDELKFIDEAYLSKFNQIKVDSFIPLQKPFKAMKEIVSEYAIPSEGNLDNQTFLSLSFVAGQGIQRDLVMALEVLSEVLVNLPSAPIRRTLVEAGIGKDVSATVEDFKQNVFTVTVRNANISDRDKFRDIIFDSLKKLVKNGLDKRVVEGVINRIEFNLREGSQTSRIPKAILDNFRALTGWMFADDPFLSLEYEAPLNTVKTALTSDYLEKVIDRYLVNNPHCLLVVLKPRKGLEEEKSAKIKQELAEYKAKQSPEQLEKLVEDTRLLKEYQKTLDSPEALNTIPLLTLQDVNPKAEKLEVTEGEAAGIKVLSFPVFTNKIIYLRLMFDLSVIPQELIPYMALLSDVFAELNTENYSYGDLDTELNIHTGGVNSQVNVYLENSNDREFMPKFVVDAKVMAPKIEKLMELEGEILKNSKYRDIDRIKEVITRLHSRLEAMVKNNGLNVAVTRHQSYFSPSGKFQELTGGLCYYNFVTDIVKNFDQKADTVMANLDKVASLLFDRNNLLVGITCSKEDYPLFQKSFPRLLEFLSNRPGKTGKYVFEFEQKNEGLTSASKVQYVIEGYNFKDLGYDYSGKMQVLNQILSRDYLYNTIRVMGGAYGGFASISRNGYFWFGSYRDPNLEKTLDNYAKAVDYIKHFKADEREMTRYIIGTVSRIDRPYLPFEKGRIAQSRYLEKTPFEDIQRERDEILKITPEDIQEMWKLIADILAKNVICVYGNEKTLEDSKQLFTRLVKVVE
jgi:Zn-dependent M16 (insulinase) family peptidase